jgi:hypothetical protein
MAPKSYLETETGRWTRPRDAERRKSIRRRLKAVDVFEAVDFLEQIYRGEREHHSDAEQAMEKLKQFAHVVIDEPKSPHDAPEALAEMKAAEQRMMITAYRRTESGEAVFSSIRIADEDLVRYMNTMLPHAGEREIHNFILDKLFIGDWRQVALDAMDEASFEFDEWKEFICDKILEANPDIVIPFGDEPETGRCQSIW